MILPIRTKIDTTILQTGIETGVTIIRNILHPQIEDITIVKIQGIRDIGINISTNKREIIKIVTVEVKSSEVGIKMINNIMRNPIDIGITRKVLVLLVISLLLLLILSLLRLQSPMGLRHSLRNLMISQTFKG